MDTKNRLLLIDGNSIMNRSFYALAGRSSFTAPDGTPTGALHTYLNTLYRFIQEVQPTHICTLFDRREPTYRHERYQEYKAKRKSMPDELRIQMSKIKEILDAMRQPRYELAGYEADDLIGTYAKLGSDEGFEVYILSGDKDDFQLIDDNTVVLMPVTRPGKSVTEKYDRAALLERYQVSPEAFITLKAIMGDSSDNIPGVKGIGEKGAIELVVKHETLDEIYEHLDDYSAGVRKKLEDSREMAYLSYDLSKIDRDVPVTLPLSDLGITDPEPENLASIFQQLGLKSQIAKWNLENVEILPDDTNTDDTSFSSLPGTMPEVKWDISEDALLAAFTEAQDSANFFPVMDMPDKPDEEIYIVLSFRADEFFGFRGNRIGSALQQLASAGLGTEKYPLTAHRIKNRFKQLSDGLPFTCCFDIEIAGYILNQIEGAAPSFSFLYERAVKKIYPECPFLSDTTDKNPIELLMMEMDEGTKDDRNLAESIWRCLLIRRIAECQKTEIQNSPAQKLIYEIEMPLIIHLDRMERNGVLVDTDVLNNLHHDFQKEITRLTENIYEKTGETFNIQSPKQLSEILFVRLGLAHGKKNSSSGSYSTASEELVRLLDKHPVISDIIEYRQLTKLDSTFVQGLQKVISPKDGRVHSNFSQAMTTTGRLSSAEPNLQNIPIRTAAGSQIRKAFIAPPGYVLLDADYSQIELRLLAHLSQDSQMMDAFNRQEDIHTNTAANIFGVPKNEVQPHMRAAAKTVNFSIVYGISDFGLSQDLGISFKEAHQYIAQYYDQYPQIKIYLDHLKNQGIEKGYVETMFGRRRILKELASPNRNLRAFGERAAMNTPVQGTAADIIKIAMNRVSQRLLDEKLDARLILQVHDELLVECIDGQQEAAAKILQEAMESAVSLSVPLVAEVNAGENWFICK